MALEKGVRYYTKGHLSMEVNFPEDKIICQYCPFCRNEDSLKRWKCLLTNEYILYPFVSVGNECPIAFERESDS